MAQLTVTISSYQQLVQKLEIDIALLDREKEKIIEILKEYGDKIYCLKKDNRYPLHPSRMSYECEISKYSFD